MKVLSKLVSGFLQLFHKRTSSAVEFSAADPLAPLWKRRLALVGMVLFAIVEAASAVFLGLFIFPEVPWLAVPLFGLAVARIVVLIFDLRDVLRTM